MYSESAKTIFLALAIFMQLIFFSNGAIAQTGAAGGTVTGKIIDSESGDVMRRATISFIGEKYGAYSDVKGEYRIRNIKPGTYSIRVTYVGYAPREIANIEVKAGETLQLDIVLQPAVKTTQDVVVEAARINDNQAAMLAMRKNAAQVSDGISREEIKRLPDSDAGQSLRRVSGVTLVNDKFIFVRGVSERYSNTTLNGASLSSTEPDKKSFSFDMFPAEFIENASITKSFTPDLPGNFAGGLVQLNTVDFPMGYSLKLNVGASINDNVTLKDKAFISYSGGSRDWLGFDDGTRSMPSILPSSTMDMKKLTTDLKSQEEDILVPTSQKWVQFGKSFNNNSWKRDSISAPPNGSFTLSYSDIYNIAGNDFGIIASAMYNSGFAINQIERGQLQAAGAQFNSYSAGSESSFSTNLGGMLNLAYKFGGHTSISIKNTYNNQSEDEVTFLEGFKEQVMIRQLGYHFVQKELFATQVGGEHLLPIQNSVLDWKLGYSKSLRDEPDFKRLRYSRNDSTLPYRVDIYNLESNSYQAGRFFSNLNENSYSGSMNYQIAFENVKFKAGGFYETKKRDFLVRSFTINKSTLMLKNYYDEDFGYVVPNYGDDDFYENAFDKSPDYIFNDDNFSYTRLGISEDTRPIDSYKADESLAAGYIMAELPIVISGAKFRIIGGVRMENSMQYLKSYYPIAQNNSDSTFVDQSFVDWLPSLNIIYEVAPNMNLRFSGSRTLARPSLREYAPFTFYDFHFQGDVTGNPHLVRSLIQNYDLRWEMFPNPGEVISAGVFYKVFHNAIEETIIPTASNFKRLFTNANGNAYNYGAEFEFRKSLGFLSNSLNYFMLNLNFAVINSEITVRQVEETETRPMWGQSPYTLNLGLYYANPEWGTSFNLGYNVYGRRIVQVADIVKYEFNEPHVYELPRNQVDFSVSQSVTDYFEVKFVVKDLLNEKLIWKQADKVVASTHKGRTISLSFGYRM